MLLRKNYCRRGGLCLLLYALLCSCGSRNTAPGGREMPDRSMLPDHHILDLGEDRDQSRLPGTLAGFPFTPRYFECRTDSGAAKFLTLSLPDNAADQQVNALIDRYQLLAPALIDQWAACQTGIVIDLRNNGSHAQKEAFQVQAATTTFPVVIVWDEITAGRADRYLQWLSAVEYVRKADGLLVNDNLLQQLPAAGMPDRQLLQDIPGKDCFYPAVPTH